jgi:hypothetical protein
MVGEPAGKTTQTDTSSTAQSRQVAGAAKRKARARSPSPKTAYPSAFSQRRPLSRMKPTLRPDPDRPSEKHFHAARRRRFAGGARERPALLRTGASASRAAGHLTVQRQTALCQHEERSRSGRAAPRRTRGVVRRSLRLGRVWWPCGVRCRRRGPGGVWSPGRSGWGRQFGGVLPYSRDADIRPGRAWSAGVRVRRLSLQEHAGHHQCDAKPADCREVLVGDEVS